MDALNSVENMVTKKTLELEVELLSLEFNNH
jgi:hypothetical protein